MRKFNEVKASIINTKSAIINKKEDAMKKFNDVKANITNKKEAAVEKKDKLCVFAKRFVSECKNVVNDDISTVKKVDPKKVAKDVVDATKKVANSAYSTSPKDIVGAVKNVINNK